MASVKYRIRSKANKNVSIKIILSAGRKGKYKDPETGESKKYSGINLETNTGFSINPKQWSKTGFPKQTTPEARKIHKDLKKLETFILDHFNEANSKGEIIDLNWLQSKIVECFERIERFDQNLLENHIQYIIDNAATRQIKGTKKIGLSERRIAGYKSFLKMIQDYQSYTKRKINFLDINRAFIEKFTNWLLNNRNYSTNYAGKNLDNLKTVCMDAKHLDIPVNPYVNKIESFRERKEDKHIVTLSFDELEKIRTTEIEKEALINARKWILLGCEIGQRASDLLRLTKEDVRFENGNYYIDIIQKKTGKAITVPLIAPHIIEMVENEFPYQVSQQKLNKHIKDVCEEAEIDQKIIGRKYDKKKGRKVLKEYPKYKLVTSHSFRRSFATNYYKKMPTPVLINITGHSKESLFLEYINRPEDKDENANLFKKFYEQIHRKKDPEMRVIKNAANE